MIWASVCYRFVDPLFIGFESLPSIRSRHQCVQEPLATRVRVRESWFGLAMQLVVLALGAVAGESVLDQVLVGDSERLRNRCDLGLLLRLVCLLLGIVSKLGGDWLLAYGPRRCGDRRHLLVVPAIGHGPTVQRPSRCDSVFGGDDVGVRGSAIS